MFRNNGSNLSRIFSLAADLIRFSPTPGITIEMEWNEKHVPIEWCLPDVVTEAGIILGITTYWTPAMFTLFRYLDTMETPFLHTRENLVKLFENISDSVDDPTCFIYN